MQTTNNKENQAIVYQFELPHYLKERLERRKNKRRSNWSRKKENRSDNIKINIKDKKTKMELFKKRMNYGVNKSTEDRRKRYEKAIEIGEKPQIKRLFKSYYNKKDDKESDGEYNTKEYKMKMFKKRMNYNRDTPKKSTEPFTLHNTVKSEENIKREEIENMRMTPDANDFDSLVKTAFVNPQFFEEVIENPQSILKDMKKLFSDINNKEKLMKNLLARKLTHYYKIEGNQDLISKLTSLLDALFKSEEDLKKMENDKKTPKSLFERVKASKMKLNQIQAKKFVFETKKAKNPKIKLSPKTLSKLADEFFMITTISTTHFNDFYNNSKNTKEFVQSYFNIQVQNEVLRETTGFEGDLRQIYDLCPRTQILLNFSGNCMKEALNKVIVQKKLPILNKYKSENTTFEAFKPSSSQAWNAMLSFSKLLSMPNSTKIGELINQNPINYAIVTGWILEIKKIFLDAYYREDGLKNEPMSLERWIRWMSREEEIPENFFEMASEFMKNPKVLIENPDVLRAMGSYYLASIEKNSDIFFLEDSKNRPIYELFKGKYLYNFYETGLDQFDVKTEYFLGELLRRIYLDDPKKTLKFVKEMISFGSSTSIWKFIIKDLLQVRVSIDPKDKIVGEFMKELFKFFIEEEHYSFEAYAIVNKYWELDWESALCLLTKKIREGAINRKKLNIRSLISSGNSSLHYYQIIGTFLKQKFEKDPNLFCCTSKKISDEMKELQEHLKNNLVNFKVIDYRNESNVRIKVEIKDFEKFEKIFDSFYLICSNGPFLPSCYFKFPEKLRSKCSLQLLLGTVFTDLRIENDIHKPDLIEYFIMSVEAMSRYGVIVKVETL